MHALSDEIYSFAVITNELWEIESEMKAFRENFCLFLCVGCKVQNPKTDFQLQNDVVTLSRAESNFVSRIWSFLRICLDRTALLDFGANCFGTSQMLLSDWEH